MNLRELATSIFVICVTTLSLMPPAFGEEAGEEAEKANFIGVFVGITSEERREKGFALGIEGGHYFSRSFAIAGVLEYTFGDIDTLVGAVPLVYVMDKWKLYAGPGFEDGDASDHMEFLIRAGVEYGFEVGSIEIAPQFNIDFVDGDAVLVVGALFARRF